MVRRRRLNRSTAQLRTALDALGRSDPAAYDIAYALVHDYVSVQNGHTRSMDGGQGQRLHGRASPELQRRAVAMFGIILRLTTTEFEQDPVPPRKPRRWRRRRS